MARQKARALSELRVRLECSLSACGATPSLTSRTLMVLLPAS